MVARSRMGGPWSRAQRVARAFQDGGHEATLAWGDDGNCANPIAPTLEIPVPSPLGLPEAIARHTFPLASRLGLMGRKPVRSFEEVLWLTGALDERYTRAAVDTLRAHMRASRPDVRRDPSWGNVSPRVSSLRLVPARAVQRRSRSSHCQTLRSP